MISRRKAHHVIMEIQNAILNRRCSLRPEQLNKSKKVLFHGSRSVDTSRRNSSVKGPGPGGTSQMIAIDSKIEQAMDLVKTHLMFAVREEVEVLRAKIIELETTVPWLRSQRIGKSSEFITTN
uniref:BACK domain-containing protein n=1 Tax=Parascaris univalens TaxID=6257 RepID=A0A914ZK62_PARUN